MIPRSTLAVVVVVALCAACMHRYKGLVTTIPSLGGSTHAYTLTNLHPDDDNRVLYTANFQQPGFIPICSEVTLLRVDEDWLTFEVNATGKQPPKRDTPSLDRPMWKYGYSRMRSFVVEFGADGKVATVYD